MRRRGEPAAGASPIRPISDKTNQTDIPAITHDIFVYKNGPQRWSRPDWLDDRTDNNNDSRELPLSHSHTPLPKNGEPMKTSISSALKTPLKATACAALLASATSAFAQSSVQLYGQVDEWVGAQKFPGGKTAVQVAGGGMSTSYWGLKGSEDLGNGYKAIFALESFFRAQNGNYGRFQGDTFFARNSYVGIQSPFGTVTTGRLTTQLFV